VTPLTSMTPVAPAPASIPSVEVTSPVNGHLEPEQAVQSATGLRAGADNSENVSPASSNASYSSGSSGSEEAAPRPVSAPAGTQDGRLSQQGSTETAAPGTGARHYTMEFFEMCSALITQLAR